MGDRRTAIGGVLLCVLAGCQTWEEDSGTFAVDWELIDDIQSTGDGGIVTFDGTCEEWGVNEIVFTAHHEGGDAFEFRFPCAPGAGFSGPVPLGSYAFECSALDSASLEVARADMSLYQDFGLSEVAWDDEQLGVGCQFLRE